jgi:beta-mannosidase
LESVTNKESKASFNIHLNEHTLVENQSHDLKPESDNTVKVKFVIPITAIKIIPWFPNGVADNTQMLYNLNVSLTDSSSKEVSNKAIKIGFRKIQLIQDPIKPEGLTFYFKVNDKSFFVKGSNWIPANVLPELVTKEYLRQLLESAKEANMNMLRVWGGGIYELDEFYELADELGIMIWQDFMFACALYPTDTNFLKSVDVEIVQQVRRLQHHPSIAIWAGIQIIKDLSKFLNKMTTILIYFKETMRMRPL